MPIARQVGTPAPPGGIGGALSASPIIRDGGMESVR
jgi:hypothetical protein